MRTRVKATVVNKDRYLSRKDSGRTWYSDDIVVKDCKIDKRSIYKTLTTKGLVLKGTKV